MITRNKTLIIAFLLLMLTLPSRASAQIRGDWSPLFQLSTGNGQAIEASVVSDRFGFVHAFWAESPGAGTTLLQYSQFNGRNWTTPNDIFNVAGNEAVGVVVATLDQNDQVHLVWTQGTSKLVYYAHAPVVGARSARNWSARVRLEAQADELGIQVDENGLIHLLYVDRGEQAGIFYLRSEDGGSTWSKKTWVDPDILANHVPISLHMAQDSDGGLHAVWSYKDKDTSDGDWVRYMRSTDGGESWTIPFTIAKNSEGADKLNAFTRPIMTVEGKNVHVIWAGGNLLYRHHRVSKDAGITWSDPIRVFGDLNGQAGDGFTIDGAGRVHYFGQIRFPQGVYHAVWDGIRWSDPDMVYLLRNSAGESFGDNVEAHRTFPVVNAGNQLVLSFTDGPTHENRQLYITTHTLNDVERAKVDPIPADETETETANESVVNAVATPETVVPTFDTTPPVAQVGLATLPLWVSVFVTLAAVGLIFLVRLRRT